MKHTPQCTIRVSKSNKIKNGTILLYLKGLFAIE